MQSEVSGDHRHWWNMNPLPLCTQKKGEPPLPDFQSRCSNIATETQPNLSLPTHCSADPTWLEQGGGNFSDLIGLTHSNSITPPPHRRPQHTAFGKWTGQKHLKEKPHQLAARDGKNTRAQNKHTYQKATALMSHLEMPGNATNNTKRCIRKYP